MATSSTSKTKPVYTQPTSRRLRGYSFDPSLSTSLETALLDSTVYTVRWEEELKPGPVGEYLEVIDYDPAGQVIYPPVDLNDPYVLAQDGLTPSEGNAQFHQQMVYAVAMTTIQNFERALGRPVLWAYRVPRDEEGEILSGKANEFIQRLRIYPHALREANAYYSPEKKALLFGYFPATDTNETVQLPGGVVFTCLSHDIVAHETTHAILDGMHRRFIEPTHPDTLAFHEAFADIVALFQHFSLKEVLENQIAQTRGELQSQNLLGELAQQFGRAIGGHGSLRSAIGQMNAQGQWERIIPNPNDYRTVMEPHARGAILVATVFDAFLLIYQQRVSDLFGIATNGSGILPAGKLHPDLVKRLASEAAKTARHILTMSIRALDYCPPVDITFGDFLRAIITADIDLVQEDSRQYRTAFIEAFKRRGIYPEGLKTLSVESLTHPLASLDLSPELITEFQNVGREYRETLETTFDRLQTRSEIFKFLEGEGRGSKRKQGMKEVVHQRFLKAFNATGGDELLKKMGLSRAIQNKSQTRIRFQVESIRRARRIGPDGVSANQVIITVTQSQQIPASPLPGSDPEHTLKFRGGCNLIMDLNKLELRYIVAKDINDTERQKRQQRYMLSNSLNFSTAYYMREMADENGFINEPFALLHRL